MVADCKASIAGIPASTIKANSFPLLPCAKTPASVPKAIPTPFLYAFAKVP